MNKKQIGTLFNFLLVLVGSITLGFELGFWIGFGIFSVALGLVNPQ